MALSKAHTTSATQRWETPVAFFNFLQTWFGVTYTLDLAASHANALCENYYTEDMDSFTLPWVAPQAKENSQAVVACWCNPPFSDPKYPVGEWILRGLESHRENFSFLLPMNKMDQPWFHDLPLDKFALNIVKGRVQFLLDGKPGTYTDKKTGKEKKSGNSQGSIVINCGPAFKHGLYSLPWADQIDYSTRKKKPEPLTEEQKELLPDPEFTQITKEIFEL